MNVNTDLKNILKELSEKAKLMGAFYISQDGSIIDHFFRESVNLNSLPENLSKIIQNSKELGILIGNESFKQIIAELDNNTILLSKITDARYLILILTRKSILHGIIDPYLEYLKNF